MLEMGALGKREKSIDSPEGWFVFHKQNSAKEVEYRLKSIYNSVKAPWSLQDKPPRSVY